MPVYTEMPKNFGEKQFAQTLMSWNVDRMHLWFNVSWIPGIGEIDVILWHEHIGLFVCEVKAIKINGIEEISTSRMKFSYSNHATFLPQDHLNKKIHELKNHIDRRMRNRMPFVVPAVIWASIAKDEWLESFSGDVKAMANSMIFSNDLKSFDRFENSLVRISEHPIVGNSCKPRPIDDKGLVHEFKECISSYSQKPHRCQSESEKMRLLELDVACKSLPDLVPGESNRVLYRGRPGTGKTFRLLQHAVNHSHAERQILFYCFNKTLAAEVKSLITQNEATKRDYAPWVFDVMDLLSYMAPDYYRKLSWELGNAKDSFEIIKLEIEKEQLGNIFDLVLIDEAQDMQGWMIDMAQLFLAPGGSLVMAEGIGQQFYSEKSKELQDFSNNSKVIELTKNFRNTRPNYLFASVMSSLMDNERTDSLSDLRSLKFGRPKGKSPSIKWVSSLADFDSKTGNPILIRNKHMVEAYREIIYDALRTLYKEHGSSDMLLLVPNAEADERRWVKEALEDLEVPFVDYTQTKENTHNWRPFLDIRRSAPPSNTLRLCTYRSSRGLEASKVLVFGIDRVAGLSESFSVPAASIVHVILSRAVYETVIVLPANCDLTIKRHIGTAMNKCGGY